jgi:putative DNA primase/helicase
MGEVMSDMDFDEATDVNNTAVNINEELQRLSKLNPIEYDRVREEEAKRLGVRVSVLDKEVSRARESSGEPLKGRALEFYIPEPWNEPVDGSLVLDEAYITIKRHMAISDEYAATAVLWAAHVHVFDLFSHTPRLGISAPDAECGKTVLLSHMVGNLIPKPQHTENISPAPFFRLAELHRPSFLIDEADVFFRQDSDLIGAINGGWEPHGGVIRCIGDDHEPRHFSTHCPVAIGGIRLEKILPATTISRAIMIPLQRAMPDEITEVYDSKKHLEGLRDIGRKLARWSHDKRALIAGYEPTMPEKAINRRADKWRPLFTVAQVAGGHWPQRAISAFLAEERDDSKKMSTSQQLLSDIREVIKPHENNIATDELITRLCNLDESIWEGYNFKERDNDRRCVQPRQLSELLRGYKIKPSTIRIGGHTPKGYKVIDLNNAFKRYLPPILSATPPQPSNGVASSDSLSATQDINVADRKTPQPTADAECGGVADKNTLNPDSNEEPPDLDDIPPMTDDELSNLAGQFDDDEQDIWY